MANIGIDLHHNNLVACYMVKGHRPFKKRFPLDEGGLGLFLASLSKRDSLIVEASSNAFVFVEKIQPFVKEIIVGDTYQLGKLFKKKKTDKLDSEKLATYLEMAVASKKHLFHPVYVPNKTIQKLRSLFTTYKMWTADMTRQKNRIYALSKQFFLPAPVVSFTRKGREELLEFLKDEPDILFQVEELMDIIDFQKTKLKKIEKEIIKTSAAFRKQVDIITSVKGISLITAVAIIADMADIARFPNAKKFCSYLRTAPGVAQSGEPGKAITLQTSRHSRSLTMKYLPQASVHFKTSNPRIGSLYKRALGNGKRAGLIRMAACRKVLVEVYHMLKTGTYHFYRDKENHNQKMEVYDRILVKHELLPAVAA